MNNQIILNIRFALLNYKKIGLLLSGGFDSSLLSYLMHDERNKLMTYNTFEYFTVPRYDDSIIHANRIIDFIDNKFNNTPSIRHVVGDPELDHSQQVSSGVRYVLRYYKDIDILSCGENITPDELPGGPIRSRSTHSRLHQPFYDYTKDILVQLAIDMNLIDIMKMSHTCTESTMLRCGNCWQCKERAWAFGRCNYIDPGLM